MRPSSSQQPQPQPQLGVGDCVAVKPKASDSGGAKRLGRVQRLRSSGAVDVFYADGRVEERVARDRLAPDSSKTSSRTRAKRPLAARPSTSTSHDDALEDKAPAPGAEAQRRARTAAAKRRQPAEASAHTARAAQQQQKQQQQKQQRQRDVSDSVARTQQQVADIMAAITAPDADAVAVKNALSLLLRVIRSAPQVTAECIHEQNGELRLLATIQTHASHAVLLCYGCVLMRKLCHLSAESVELFLQHGIVPAVAQALLSFPEDAILQASACGCLAVLTQTSDASKGEMLAMSEPSILALVLTSLDSHREYSNLTRQVQIYACEVLTELCDFGGPPTVGSLIAHDPRRKTESPIELAVSLTRQSMAREDKKVTCSFCSLLLCLASNSSTAAESLREVGAIADISVVMAKYPIDEGDVLYDSLLPRCVKLRRRA
ncbi:Armadillo-type fold [Phytophthora cinnamomi]|uniref:Armadillo-type fold n=1 Tax=Phytophthora cinnamomi TaxID=4785 RepID=UPI003559CBBE|nr:Armadillo-type fold [Phytophthora cinnamomi]